MSELLPTPRAQNAEPRNSRIWQRPDGEPQNLENALARVIPTSASSQGSVAWISRWKRRGIPASGRSSGTPTAPASSSDGGRLFPVGETSEGSALLPTPAAGMPNYDEDPETWEARRRKLAEKGINGNGAETPLGVAVRWTAWDSSWGASRVSQPPPPADGREPQMIAGYGLSSPVSLASYDPELSSWRTFQASLLSTEDERYPRSWERWPTSGMTRRGRAFALPTSARPTDGNGSSYLHTPTTGDTQPNYDHRASPGYERAKPVPNLAAQIEDELLPTPRHEGFDAGNHRGQPDGLPQTVRNLLPTPKTPTGGSEARKDRQARGSGGEDLEARLRSLGDLTTSRSDAGSEP